MSRCKERLATKQARPGLGGSARRGAGPRGAGGARRPRLQSRSPGLSERVALAAGARPGAACPSPPPPTLPLPARSDPEIAAASDPPRARPSPTPRGLRARSPKPSPRSVRARARRASPRSCVFKRLPHCSSQLAIEACLGLAGVPRCWEWGRRHPGGRAQESPLGRETRPRARRRAPLLRKVGLAESPRRSRPPKRPPHLRLSEGAAEKREGRQGCGGRGGALAWREGERGQRLERITARRPLSSSVAPGGDH